MNRARGQLRRGAPRRSPAREARAERPRRQAQDGDRDSEQAGRRRAAREGRQWVWGPRDGEVLAEMSDDRRRRARHPRAPSALVCLVPQGVRPPRSTAADVSSVRALAHLAVAPARPLDERALTAGRRGPRRHGQTIRGRSRGRVVPDPARLAFVQYRTSKVPLRALRQSQSLRMLPP